MIDSQLIQTLGLVLIHFTWQGLLIGLLFGAGRLALRDSTAVARYNWATTCLVLLALAPLATFAWLSFGTGQQASAGLTMMSESIQSGAAGTVSGSSGWTLTAFLPVIVGLWLCGVVLMSLRLGLGWWYLHQLRRDADPRVPQAIQAQLESIASQLNMARRVGVALSSRIAGPMLIGVFKPLILIPTGLVNGLSPRHMEMVLAHELAHLYRADHLVNLFQNIVETLLFYHPVVRWVSNQIRAERELASDELVARLTGDRITYAETLLKLEQARGLRPQLAIGMADHQLVTRVRHLLAPNPRQTGSAISGIVIVTVVVVSMLMALASTSLRALTDQDEHAGERPDVAAEIIPDSASLDPAASVTRTVPDAEAASPAMASRSDLPAAAETEAPTLALLDPEILSAATSAPRPAIEPESIETRIEPTPAQPEAIGNAVNEDVGVVSPPVEPAPQPETRDPEPPAPEIQLAALPEIPDARPSADQPLELASLEPIRETRIRGGAVLERAVPTYPAGAVRQRREGRADIKLTVGPDGRVIHAEIVEETPKGYGFGRSALQAAEQWRFEPFTRDGEAVRHVIQTGFDFTDPPVCDRVTGTRISRC
jgi:bla regulator protein blaR1